MVHIEETLKKSGTESIRLDAFPQNPYAIKMYRKLGYKKVGDLTLRKGDFILMEKIL
jgi:ribosomal protein S18 acetylase RimI-like enzyme